MASHIIETIGAWGVKTTPLQFRTNEPKPGDPIDISAIDGYPFDGRTRAYVDYIDKETKRANVCIGNASMFLLESGGVSISGGPFWMIPLALLEWQFGLENVHFWNWGDNSAGASQGVDYFVPRPLFKLLRKPEV